MAFNFPMNMMNMCPMCSNYHPQNQPMSAYQFPRHSQYCNCAHRQMPCPERCNSNVHQMEDKGSCSNTRPPPNRRTKLTRSRSAHGCTGMDVCGDIVAAKGACACYDRNKARAARLHSSFKCCSSSGEPPRHGAQERRRRQPQSRYFPAPPCDINRLMSMVRDAHRYDSCSDDCCTDTPDEDDDDDDDDDENGDGDEEDTEGGSTSTRLPLLPANTEFSDSDMSYDEDDVKHFSLIASEGQRRSCMHHRGRSRNMRTKVKFTPPASCIMLVKKADQQRLVKIDRQVQCCFDISSDFCSCSKAVCEFCAKKIVCTCSRVRCCMCAKLKSTADRKLLAIFVCRCPKIYRCCSVGSSFQRFNSSPTLGARGSLLECATTSGGRPFSF